MKPSEVGKPYPVFDPAFIEPVYKMSQTELDEKMLKIKVQKKLLKNEAVEQLKDEIKAIVNKIPIDLIERGSILSRVIKIERVIEEFYNP